MSAPVRCHATNAVDGAPSRVLAAVSTEWFGPATDIVVHGHKYPYRRLPL